MSRHAWAVGCLALVGCRQLLDIDDYQPIATGVETPGCVDPKAPETGNCSAAGACALVLLADSPGSQIGPRSYPFGMAVDDTHVYWASQDHYDGGGTGVVQRVLKQPGGSVEPLSDLHARPKALAVDDRYLYWVSELAGTPTVARVPKDQPCCATPEALYVGEAGSPLDSIMLVGPETLFVLGPQEMFRLAFSGVQWERSAALPSAVYPSWSYDGEHMYWTAMDERVYRVSLDGARREPWGDPLGGLVTLGSGCKTLFGYSQASGKIVELTTGAAVEVAAPGVLEARQLAVDERFVYVAVWNAGGIDRVPRSGGMTKRIAQGNIWGMALDSEAVYFAEHGGSPGAVYKVPKQ